MEQVKQYVVADGLIDLGVKGGTFVRLEDYAALQQKLDAVLAENVVLKAAIPNLKDVDYENDNMDDVSLAEEIGFNDAVTLMNRWKGETPATDTMLNEVRAEGVEMYANYFISNHTISVGMVKRTTSQLAAQLRAGSTEGGV